MRLSDPNPSNTEATASFLARIEAHQIGAVRRLDPERQVAQGQFFTPVPIAEQMARMIDRWPSDLRLLDPGAGSGVLSAACVAIASDALDKPSRITVTAFELDPTLAVPLEATFQECLRRCDHLGIKFEYRIIGEDFVATAAGWLGAGGLFSRDSPTFNAAILNPPYKKIQAHSDSRRFLKSVGLETSNLYSGFVWLAMELLEAGGQLVSITPRSFCNGPYFRPFRLAFFREMATRHVHIFNARNKAFGDDGVLQENVILHAAKGGKRAPVAVSSSDGVHQAESTCRAVPYAEVIQQKDNDVVLHIVPNELDAQIHEGFGELRTRLSDLKVGVSTGRVVDFRAKLLLQKEPGPNSLPLIYPLNLQAGAVVWPVAAARKPQALGPGDDRAGLLVPSGYYVLVKRFSAKEEKRRVTAAIFDPTQCAASHIGFENHLNYFHRDGRGLPAALARGLAAFLNSSLVDQYVRQFNGHTQINATDLRNLRYPTEAALLTIGEQVVENSLSQTELDRLITSHLAEAFSTNGTRPNSMEAKQRIEEALQILRALGVPREQQNERSALTLLALLDLEPATLWQDAGDPLRGITAMMDYFRKHYGVSYAPNTRETVRRQTIHQFVQMGLVLENPDKPGRPINSPDYCYQMEPSALELFRSFGSTQWSANLAGFLATAETMQRLHAQERTMTLIPVTLPNGEVFEISGGGQNLLIKDIVEKFCPHFTPGALVVYLGDAGEKHKIHDAEYLKNLGIVVDLHGKMPDVIVHLPAKNWLVLIEAVTSHGPINIKRHNELKILFGKGTVPLVFVTAFASRKAMVKYLAEIAWETEVWIAESPSHLIHFDGERFLGPYQ